MRLKSAPLRLVLRKVICDWRFRVAGFVPSGKGHQQSYDGEGTLGGHAASLQSYLNSSFTRYLPASGQWSFFLMGCSVPFSAFFVSHA